MKKYFLFSKAGQINSRRWYVIPTIEIEKGIDEIEIAICFLCFYASFLFVNEDWVPF